MKRYEKKDIKWLISKPGGLFLTRRSERRFAEQWTFGYSVGIHRSVEKRNNTILCMPSGMRPAFNKQGCIPTECLVLCVEAFFYRAVFPTGMEKDYQGNNRIVFNSSGGIVQANNYYPYGASYADTLTQYDQHIQPYKYNGKELDRIMGLDYYDYSARFYDPIQIRFITMDPLAERYYGVSPYVYALNNPIKYVDPDGQVVRLANNYVGGMENIARIAATNYGSQMMSHLIGQRRVYYLNSTFWTRSSGYNPSNGDINYVGNPWYSELPDDGGVFNSMIAMGHEGFHAYDHSIGIFNSSNYRREITEPRAVSFENYLRQSYSLSPLREGFGNIQGNFHQFPSNEKISNFTTLGNNADKTSYGFSYTKTTTIVESYKKGFLGMKIPDKTRKETTTYYMTVSRDKNNNASFRIYDNEEEYKKATSNW